MLDLPHSSTSFGSSYLGGDITLKCISNSCRAQWTNEPHLHCQAMIFFTLIEIAYQNSLKSQNS